MNLFQVPDDNNVLQIVRYNDLIHHQVTSNPGDKIPGIYEQLQLSWTLTCTGTSFYTLYSDPVPSGYIWHVQAVYVYYNGTITGRAFGLRLYVGQNFSPLAYCNLDSTAKAWYVFQSIYLLPGSKLAFVNTIGENGKHMDMYICGVTMRINT